MAEDFIVLTLAIGLGWLFLKVVRFTISTWGMLRRTEELKTYHTLNKSIHFVRIERSGESEYWYDESTKKFLGQGKNLEKIASQLKVKFPTNIFIIKEYDGGVAAKTDWKLIPSEQFNEIQFEF